MKFVTPSPSLSLLLPPPYKMSQQQQQQQQQEEPSPELAPYLLLPSREEQLLSIIANLQQQVNTMLLQQQGSGVEVARPLIFGGKMEEVNTFINVARLYLRMKINEKAAMTQIAQGLSYVQGGVVEAWKDNLLDKLAKRESEIKITKGLFTKIRNEFREILEEEKKVEQQNKRGELAMSMCRNSRRSLGEAATREDPSLKNSKES